MPVGDSSSLVPVLKERGLTGNRVLVCLFFFTKYGNEGIRHGNETHILAARPLTCDTHLFLCVWLSHREILVKQVSRVLRDSLVMLVNVVREVILVKTDSLAPL